MSAWDAYIKNMKDSGLQICGIYGLEGGVWAQSPEIKPSQQEIANIVSGIRSQSFPNGIHIGGVKYTVIRFDSESATAKCKNAANEQENYLLHCALGKTCILVGGMCGANERDATMKVEGVRDYLVKSNY